MTRTSNIRVPHMRAAIVALGLALTAAFVHAGERTLQTTSVSIRVEGESTTAVTTLERLKKRGARQGIAVTSDGPSYQLRILVLARGPQWHQVFGVSASGAVAVLDARGELLWMHLRQKEATTGEAIDEMVGEILARLPALLRGEKMLTH